MTIFIFLLAVAGAALAGISNRNAAGRGPAHEGSSVAAPDPAFDCAWRALAYDYGRALQPERGVFPSLFDALELATLCHQTLPTTAGPPAAPAPAPVWLAGDLFVDPVHGNDNNAGSVDAPLQTIPAALDRRRRDNLQGTIVLRGGQPLLGHPAAFGPGR